MLVVGADVHDVRVWDREQSYTGAEALTNLADHQRDSAAYAEAMWEHKSWTIVAGSRMDWFQNYDGHETQWNGSTWVPTAAQPPQRDERIFDPRLGVSRKLSDHWALTASGFRAFRAPTPNELYRSTQVGSELTLPNGSLLSERATGWEAGIAAERSWGSIRSSYFLTQVNRPIVAVTTCATVHADSAHARKSRPDREPRHLSRLSNFIPARGSRSTAAISTRTPWSRAATS